MLVASSREIGACEIFKRLYAGHRRGLVFSVDSATADTALKGGSGVQNAPYFSMGGVTAKSFAG
jgi:hypothetical protein